MALFYIAHSMACMFRTIARILVRGVQKIRAWGQARPDRSRAGVRFLGRGQPAPIS